MSLIIDLNADDLAGSVSDGGAVASWSNNSIAFTQATTGAKPSLALAQLNGRASVRFAGGSKWLAAPLSGTPLDALETSGMTATFVARFATTNQYQTLLAKCQNGTSNRVWYCYWAGQVFRLDDVKGGQIATDTWHIITISESAADGAGQSTTCIYIDGELVNQITEARRAANTTDPFTIGATNLAVNGAMTGDIARVRIYDAVLSAADAEAGLRAYYGLPAAHVFDAAINIAVVGDSIVQGYGTTIDWPALLQAQLGNVYKVNNLGLGGTVIHGQMELASITAARDARLVSGATNVLLVAAGTNDIVQSSRTALQLEADYQAYCAAAQTAGWKVIAMPIIPRANMDATMEGYRLAFNAWVLANWTTFADAYCDTLSNPAIGTPGTDGYYGWRYTSSGTPLAYTVDGTHPNAQGQREYAAGVSPGLMAYLLTLPGTGGIDIDALYTSTVPGTSLTFAEAIKHLDADVSGVPEATDTLVGSDGTNLSYVSGNVFTALNTVTSMNARLPANPAATGDAMTLTGGERTTLAGVVWAALTSALTTAGSIGKKLADAVFGGGVVYIPTPGALLDTDQGQVLPETRTMKRTSTLPALSYALYDGNGVPVGLPDGTTAVCNIRDENRGEIQIGAAADVSIGENGVTPAVLTYQWQDGDLDTDAPVFAEYRLTLPGGGIQIWPSGGDIKITVIQDLG